MVFQDLCLNTGSIEELCRNCEIRVFNEITDSSMMDSLARIVVFAFCWDNSQKANKIFYFNQIAPGIEIFSDKKCKVTFGFEYIS